MSLPIYSDCGVEVFANHEPQGTRYLFSTRSRYFEKEKPMDREQGERGNGNHLTSIELAPEMTFAVSVCSVPRDE
jgi:hypothetical protein